MVCGARSREERRAEAVLRERSRPPAGRLRSLDEHHTPGAHRGTRRGRSRVPDAQGRHPRRIVRADAPPRSARHPGELRRCAAGRVPARIGGADRARRHDMHGVAGREPPALLPPRVVRQVHAVPRRHRLAVQDPRQDRTWRGRDARSRSAVQHFRQHRRQDALRVRRCGRHARAHHAKALPRRIRGARPRGTLHAEGDVAWTRRHAQAGAH